MHTWMYDDDDQKMNINFNVCQVVGEFVMSTVGERGKIRCGLCVSVSF